MIINNVDDSQKLGGTTKNYYNNVFVHMVDEHKKSLVSVRDEKINNL